MHVSAAWRGLVNWLVSEISRWSSQLMFMVFGTFSNFSGSGAGLATRSSRTPRGRTPREDVIRPREKASFCEPPAATGICGTRESLHHIMCHAPPSRHAFSELDSFARLPQPLAANVREMLEQVQGDGDHDASEVQRWRMVAQQLADEVAERDVRLQALASHGAAREAKLHQVLDLLHSLSVSVRGSGDADTPSAVEEHASAWDTSRLSVRLPEDAKRQGVKPSDVNVMVVHDGRFELRMLEIMCERAGFASIHACSSGEMALQQLAAGQRPQLVLCGMQHGDSALEGITILEQLRGVLANDAAIVIVTTNATPQLVERCLMHDADSVVDRPLRSERQLLSLLHFIARRQRTARVAVERVANLHESILRVEADLKSMLASSPTSSAASLHGPFESQTPYRDVGQASERGRSLPMSDPAEVRSTFSKLGTPTLEVQTAAEAGESPCSSKKGSPSGRAVKFGEAWLDERLMERTTELLMPLVTGLAASSASPNGVRLSGARSPGAGGSRSPGAGGARSLGAGGARSPGKPPRPLLRKGDSGDLRSMLLHRAVHNGASDHTDVASMREASEHEAATRRRHSAPGAVNGDGVGGAAVRRPSALCRLCEQRVDGDDLGSHVHTCAAWLALRRAQYERNAELRELLERMQAVARRRLSDALVVMLGQLRAHLRKIGQLQQLCRDACSECASSADTVMHHIGALSALFVSDVFRSQLEGDVEADYFSQELRALIGEKVAAVKEMVHACPETLDAPMPASLIGVPTLRDFHLLRRIARGGFGSVWVARKVSSGDVFALKVLRKDGQRRMKRIEDLILRQHTSNYLVRGYFSFATEHHVVFALEYCPGGDLDTALKHMGCIPEGMAQFYFAEALLGLRYLHSEGVLHHDIKPQNMLISATGHLKLADFGLSATMHAKYRVGTLPYVAPETLRGEPGTCAIDMWSYGVVLLEVLTGERPFACGPSCSVQNMLASIEQRMNSNGAWQPCRSAMLGMTDAAMQLCVALLVMAPDQRPLTEAVQRHPFFDGLQFDELQTKDPPFLPRLGGPADSSYFEATPGYCADAEDPSDEFSDGTDNGDPDANSFKGGIHSEHLIRLSLQ